MQLKRGHPQRSEHVRRSLKRAAGYELPMRDPSPTLIWATAKSEGITALRLYSRAGDQARLRLEFEYEAKLWSVGADNVDNIIKKLTRPSTWQELEEHKVWQQ